MRARRPRSIKCRRCKTKMKTKPRGPLPTFCRSCRQRHYEEGRTGHIQTVLTQEINRLKVQQIIRAEVKRYLDRFTIVSEPHPSRQTAERKKRPPLRIVRNDSPISPP
jgi:hypothetical protein